MGIFGKLFKNRRSRIKTGFLYVAAGLVLIGTLSFIWSPVSYNDSVYGAPCELGEEPKVVDCEIAPPSDCDPQIKQCSGATECTGDDCGLIDKYLNPIIRFLAAIVGLVVVISIVVGGIQYASAGDDPQKVSKAKERILNSLLGLLTFLLLYGLLEWFIPGGLI